MPAPLSNDLANNIDLIHKLRTAHEIWIAQGGTTPNIATSTSATNQLYQSTVEALKTSLGNPLEVRRFLMSCRGVSLEVRTIANQGGSHFGTMIFTTGRIATNVGIRSNELAKHLLGMGGGAALVGTYWQAICAFCSLDIGAIALGGAEAMAVGGAFVLAASLAGVAIGYTANSLMESVSLMLTDKPLVDHYFSDDNAAWAHQNLAWAGF